MPTTCAYNYIHIIGMYLCVCMWYAYEWMQWYTWYVTYRRAGVEFGAVPSITNCMTGWDLCSDVH